MNTTMNTKTQKVVVVAFIEDKGKLLILKRNKNKKFLPGYFELPGGKVEFGEDEKDALKRELKEELNVNIDIGRPFHTFSFFFDENTQGIEIGYFAKLKEPVEKIKLIEHEDSKWVAKNELDKYKISDKEKELMIKGFELLEEKRPRIGSSVLVEHNGKLLLGLRNKENANNLWIIPGGGVNFGETTKDAAIREIKEETNLDVDIEKLIGYKEIIAVPHDYHSTVFFYLAKAKNNDISNLKVSDDISDARFFSVDEIKKLKKVESVNWVLKEAGFLK